MKLKKILLAVLLTFPILSGAHPVAFRGSLGLMGYHSPEMSQSQINYSWRHWIATGMHHIRRNDPNFKNRHATLGSVNLLLKRWNGPAYQGNLYALVGAGQSELSGESKAAGLGGLQFDVEDRKYYFLANHTQVSQGDLTDFRQTRVRVGLAPYVAKFEDLHSWLIFEWNQAEFGDDGPIEELTPMLRVFYRNLLFEVGQSFQGQTRFNYIIHY